MQVSTLEQLAEKLATLEGKLTKLEEHVGYQERPAVPQSTYTALDQKSDNTIFPTPVVDKSGSSGNWLGFVSVICFVLAGC